MKHVDEMRTKDNKDEGQRTGLCKGSWCHRTTLTVMSSYVSQSSFVANRHVYEGDPRHFPEAIWTSLEPNTKRNLQITIRNLGEEKNDAAIRRDGFTGGGGTRRTRRTLTHQKRKEEKSWSRIMRGIQSNWQANPPAPRIHNPLRTINSPPQGPYEPRR